MKAVHGGRLWLPFQLFVVRGVQMSTGTARYYICLWQRKTSLRGHHPAGVVYVRCCFMNGFSCF